MESSDSDDCMITNFVEAKDNKVFIIEDEEPLLKKFKSEKRDDLDVEDLELVIVPGDGHCIAHCFSKYFNQPLKEVLKLLKNEFCHNIEHYEEFSLFSKEEILCEVKEYIKTKRYNNETSDMFLHAFSRAYRVNVKVFQNDHDDLFIDGGFNQTIKLLKGRDHYDLYKPRNKGDVSTDILEIERYELLLKTWKSC